MNDLLNIELPEIDFGDVGGIDVGDISLDDFDLIDDVTPDSNGCTYTKPKVFKKSRYFVTYSSAKKLARELRLNPTERADVLVDGSFIFGDFIEAYFTQHHAHAKELIITTLSMSQENIDSLRNLLEWGLVDKLDIVISAMFYAHERRRLIPYLYKELNYKGTLQLAVADVHTKTAQFETYGGRKIVIHGSANLRSNGAIEQFTIEENSELYDFYKETFGRLIETYKTIQKPIRKGKCWDILHNN